MAAVLVVFYHCVFIGALNDNAFVRAGYLFVDFFFVLSGFVIAYAYADRIKTPPAALGFMIRRFGRLWPLHVAMLCTFALAEGLNGLLLRYSGSAEAFHASVNDNSPYSFLTYLALLNAVGLHRSITWNGASWSIGAEFYAYIVFCVVLLFFRGAALRLSAGIALFGALVVLSFSAHQPLKDATYDLGFFRCLYGFFVGVLVHALYANVRAKGGALLYASALEAAVVAIAAAFMALSATAPYAIAAPLFFAPVVYIFAFEGGAISRLLLARPFAALGAWSYSIYMIQGLIANAYNRGVRLVDHIAGLPPPARVMIGGPEFWAAHGIAGALALDILNLILVACVIAASSLTFRWVEAPARKYFNGVAKRVEAGSQVAKAVAETA